MTIRNRSTAALPDPHAASNGLSHSGSAPAATVEQVYGHVDVHDPFFTAALEQVWGTRP